jgi:acylphosphatase
LESRRNPVSEAVLEQRGYRVTGRVQGVYFRAWTQDLARELGLMGTVRNKADGSVEAHALGRAQDLDVFQARLWEGPPGARVDAVEVMESVEPILHQPFGISY